MLHNPIDDGCKTSRSRMSGLAWRVNRVPYSGGTRSCYWQNYGDDFGGELDVTRVTSKSPFRFSVTVPAHAFSKSTGRSGKRTIRAARTITLIITMTARTRPLVCDRPSSTRRRGSSARCTIRSSGCAFVRPVLGTFAPRTSTNSIREQKRSDSLDSRIRGWRRSIPRSASTPAIST